MPAQSLTFNPTGAIETWRVPNHTPGTLRITAAGGSGGRKPAPNGAGGAGGSVRGYLSIAPGTPLYVIAGYVGKRWDSGSAPTIGPALGGEGAVGGRWSSLDGGASGGTASEVRTSTNVADRIIVAGGGGGGSRGGSSGGGGGYAGGLGIGNGGGAPTWSYGGTTSAPGAASTGGGAAGVGGVGGIGFSGSVFAGGGGGGGYYGGGGGGEIPGTPIGGGGGSSWCDTGLFSSVDNTGGNSGDGYVLIVWDGDPVWMPPRGRRGLGLIR